MKALLKKVRPAAITVLAFLLLIPFPLLAQEQAVAKYLCELGMTFYTQGRLEDALSEFNKVLLVEPENRMAKDYISAIFRQNLIPADKPAPVVASSPVSVSRNSKNETMEKTMFDLEGHTPAAKKTSETSKEKKENKGMPLRISGEAQMSMGIGSPDDFIWKRANFDLNERYKSWRMSSDDAFNRRFNTYDPAIYDSLNVNLDTQNKQGFNFHTNLTVDPWSFTGKSDKITVTGSNGDTAEVQMYYWSNTGYIMNQTAYTSLRGDSFGIPEVKVEDGKTDPFSTVSYRNSATFNIPAMKIDRQFQPLRELWLDYTNDQTKIRAFPLAYQDQAYTSDDPLGITNHGIWWKDSKWLRKYTPGNYNSQDTAPSYTKGKWDDSVSFLVKDSTGKYLTGLRGLSLAFQPQEATSFDATIATPKDLWQDYGNVDNAIAASRLKHYFMPNLMLGATFTSRSGFLTEEDNKLDSQNSVGGIDLGYEVAEGLKLQAEFLHSKSYYDMENSAYETKSRGNAYYLSFISRYPQKSIMDLKYGYDEISMDKGEGFMMKGKFYLSRMDSGFDSALSDFHNTRQDVFWSRHIHFRKPLAYYGEGMEGYSTNWDELNATRIGDGMDAGRNVLGFRFETFLEDRFSNLFDVRNVHKVGGKFVENVVRDEASLQLTDKLTAKVLGIYHKLPKTVGGIDPFVYDGNTGEFFLNSSIVDGQDASIKTGSFGLNYDFFDWLSLNGIYERTNDYTLAYGDFPRNVLRNDTTLYGSYYEDGQLYRFVQPFLYEQGIFPQPPYDFYNVFKCGLRLAPLSNMEIYLDYTRNEFESASINSDNMNHVGIELAYMPMRKMGMLFKYIYSRSQDLERLRAGITEPRGHHNFFTEFRYLPSPDDEFIFQYGAGDTSSIGNLSSLDPYGGSMLTLDTQHIFRAYYRRKF